MANLAGDAAPLLVLEAVPPRVVLVKESSKTVNRRRGNSWYWIFAGGITVGALLGGYAIKDSPPVLDATSSLSSIFAEFDIPFVESSRLWLASTVEPFSVGLDAVAKGQVKKDCVVIIPGIISSGLESWGTNRAFRSALWGGGSTSMLRSMISDKKSWIESLLLDPVTGLDLPGTAKVRAAEGLSAASEFIPGYWIWAKVIENLSVIGYDHADLHLASYDWRLSYSNLEVRDQYFSRLKAHIEFNQRIYQRKTTLISHSMGTTVTLYFLHWIQDDAWIEKHISNLVNVGGTLLGVPKAMTAILSGEMRDTVDLPVALSSLVERLFSRKERAKLFRNWGGASSMYLKGGNAVWGDLESAPDDLPGATESYGPLLRFKNSTRANLTLDGSRNFLTDHTPLAFQNMLAANWSTGMERDSQQIERNQLPKNQRTWSNPLESRLPNAPSMKIYCIYGQGKETERAYHYVTENSEAFIDGGVSAAGEPVIRNGVLMGEGDGTVSLLSLGAMCVDGWKRSRYNPSKIPVVTYEIKHDPTPFDPRGGDKSGDHIDILGNRELISAILSIVGAGGGRLEGKAGAESNEGDGLAAVTDRIYSNVVDYAAKIKWDL